MRQLVFAALLAAWAAQPTNLCAVPPYETLELRGGGQVAGKVLKEYDALKGGYVSIQVDEDIAVAIDKARVARVRTKDQLTQYAQRAAAAGDDPEKHYELGIWCNEHRLMQQRLYHYQRAITLDPEHRLARANLKYVRDKNGKWIPYAVQQRNRGLIWSNGGWEFPESVSRIRSEKDAKVKASQWVKEVAKLRSQFLGRGKNKQEALAALQGIRDPLASAAIAGELIKTRGKNIQPRGVRLLWVKLLGSFHTSTSVRALVAAGLEEPDPVVREAALKELQTYGHQSAIASYTPKLNPKKNSVESVRKGLRGLTYFPRPAMAFTYIDALVTTHLTVPPKGPGIQAGFTNTGGAGSFSTGSSDKPVPTNFKNMDALTLLKQIEPNVDYGFNQQQWREYFASKLTAYQGSLRRDP